MKTWFDSLSATERRRRAEFAKLFKRNYVEFRALPLGNARHISEHRTGKVPVKVTISGRFGVTYIGGPAKRVPISESRQIDDATFPFMQRSTAIQPNWNDFDIDGHPLFSTCREYLNHAHALVKEARVISLQAHGTNGLTSPPS